MTTNVIDFVVNFVNENANCVRSKQSLTRLLQGPIVFLVRKTINRPFASPIPMAASFVCTKPPVESR